jgi:glycosyltransferase involved in cell wall biosynthesis
MTQSAEAVLMDEPLRVLAVIPGSDCGPHRGLAQEPGMIFVRRQVESLRRAGIDVSAFYLASRTSPIRVLQEWRRLRTRIKETRPHLLHAHYGTVTSAICALATIIPLVITFRGDDLNFQPEACWARVALGHLLSQLSALRSSRMLCVSARLRQQLWWRKQNALVVPTGVDMDLFRPQPKQRCRDLLGWHRTEPIVLFNAGWDPLTKGLDIVRAAVKVAEQRIGPLRLVVTRSNVAPDQMPLYLNAADCLVLASFREGSPNIIKEALACNLPIVSVDVGDVPERLRGVHPSRIVAREPYQIGCALAEILSLGQRSNGREAVQECSETQIAAIIATVYRSAATTKHERNAYRQRESDSRLQCNTTQSRLFRRG